MKIEAEINKIYDEEKMKGIATVKIKLTKKGTFKYTVKYSETAKYKAITKTNYVVIKK